MQDHRLAQIVDGLVSLFDTLKQPTNVSGFPIKVQLVLKTYHHWSALQTQAKRLRRPMFPTLMLNFGSGGARIPGGTQAEFASLGQREDQVPFTLIALLKKKDSARDVSTDLTDELTDQVSNCIFSIERLINGTHDLGVDGVVKVEVAGIPETSEGRAAAVSATSMEIIVFRILVTHVYSSARFE